MHTLFALEDLYGIKIEQSENKISLTLDSTKPTTNQSVFGMLSAWAEQAEKYRNGEITKDQYDDWRYNYPKYDESFVKVPSKNLSDAMVEAFKGRLKAD